MSPSAEIWRYYYVNSPELISALVLNLHVTSNVISYMIYNSIPYCGVVINREFSVSLKRPIMKFIIGV